MGYVSFFYNSIQWLPLPTRARARVRARRVDSEVGSTRIEASLRDCSRQLLDTSHEENLAAYGVPLWTHFWAKILDSEQLGRRGNSIQWLPLPTRARARVRARRVDSEVGSTRIEASPHAAKDFGKNGSKGVLALWRLGFHFVIHIFHDIFDYYLRYTLYE